MGWNTDSRTMRMGGISGESIGKALARCPAVERYQNINGRQFL